MCEPRMANSIEIKHQSNTSMSMSMAMANGERLSALTQ